MKNAIMIFENSLVNLSKDKLNELLESLAFNLFSSNLNASNELFLSFLESLEKANLLDEKSASLLIKALVSASLKDDRNKLFSYISEQEVLENKISNQKNIIKNKANSLFEDIENLIENSKFQNKLKDSLNDAILFDIDTLDILKETAESAFLTTLERGEDVELYINEISKNLIYSASLKSEFDKARILRIAEIVMNTAFELANETLPYAKELSLGAIKGAQEGIFMAIEKLKNSFKFSQSELDLNLKLKQLSHIEDDFIALLKSSAQTQNEPVKALILNLLEFELDSFFAKFKRLANEGRSALNLALNELKKNAKIDDLTKQSMAKIENFKQEILKLENVNLQKYKEENLSKAKNLGVLIWQKAKSILNKK